MSENLKPCPFCGSRDVDVFDAGGEPYGPSQPYVHCNNCCADSKMCDSLDKAIAAWNRRAIDVDALREVVYELECAYRSDDYASVDALCELSNDASKALAKRIRKAVGL